MDPVLKPAVERKAGASSAAQTVGDGLSDPGRGSDLQGGQSGAQDSQTVGGYNEPKATDFSRFPEPYRKLLDQQVAASHGPVQ